MSSVWNIYIGAIYCLFFLCWKGLWKFHLLFISSFLNKNDKTCRSICICLLFVNSNLLENKWWRLIPTDSLRRKQPFLFVFQIFSLFRVESQSWKLYQSFLPQRPFMFAVFRFFSAPPTEISKLQIEKMKNSIFKSRPM